MDERKLPSSYVILAALVASKACDPEVLPPKAAVQQIVDNYDRYRAASPEKWSEGDQEIYDRTVEVLGEMEDDPVA